MLKFLKKKYKSKDGNDSNAGTPGSMRRILSKLSLKWVFDSIFSWLPLKCIGSNKFCSQSTDDHFYERPSSRSSNVSTRSKKRQRSKSLTGDERSLSQGILKPVGGYREPGVDYVVILAAFLSKSIENLKSDPYHLGSTNTISYSGRMTESKTTLDDCSQQTVFIPLQTKTQLEDFEVRKHYKVSMDST